MGCLKLIDLQEKTSALKVVYAAEKESGLEEQEESCKVVKLEVAYKVASKGGVDWYGKGGKGNWTIGTIATGLELFSGVTRVGSDFSIRTATASGRVFYGNQFVKTFSLSKAGGLLGQASAGAGVIMDGVGVINHYQNPNSPNAVHPGKATLNTAMSAAGLWVNPAALIAVFWCGFISSRRMARVSPEFRKYSRGNKRNFEL